MAQKIRLKGIPKVTAYHALASFGSNVVVLLTGNLLYPTVFPALATIDAARIALQDDIALWGPVGARGSHVQLMQMRADAFALRNLLVQLQGSVLTTIIATGGSYADQAVMAASSGFGVKNPPVPQGLLGVPQNFHQFFKNGISIYHVGLKWKKPTGLNSPGNVKEYQIFRGTTDSFTDPTTLVIGTSTKTLFIDSAPIPGAPSTNIWYFVAAVNTAGVGAPTAPLAVVPILH